MRVNSLAHPKPISQNSPLIIGHRGASALAPENTLAAFARAIDDGADGIELDVRLAKDGVPVVIHDAMLRRTGLVSGKVERLTSKALADVRAGVWFNRKYPARARAAYETEGIPTLSQVFQLLSDRRGVIYVELKTEGSSGQDLAQAVAASIAEHKFQDRAVVISFDLPTIARTKSLNSSIRTGALFSPQRRPGVSWRVDTILKATAECGADELLPHHLLVRPGLIEKAKDKNLPVVVWTVDDPNWVTRARTMGIHALMTNDPARMLHS